MAKKRIDPAKLLDPNIVQGLKAAYEGHGQAGCLGCLKGQDPSDQQPIVANSLNFAHTGRGIAADGSSTQLSSIATAYSPIPAQVEIVYHPALQKQASASMVTVLSLPRAPPLSPMLQNHSSARLGMMMSFSRGQEQPPPPPMVQSHSSAGLVISMSLPRRQEQGLQPLTGWN